MKQLYRYRVVHNSPLVKELDRLGSATERRKLMDEIIELGYRAKYEPNALERKIDQVLAGVADLRAAPRQAVEQPVQASPAALAGPELDNVLGNLMAGVAQFTSGGDTQH